MATKKIQLVNGSNDLLMPATSAHMVDCVRTITVKGLTYGKYWNTNGTSDSGGGSLYAYYPHLIHLKKGDVLELRNYSWGSYYQQTLVVYPTSDPANGTKYKHTDSAIVKDPEVDTTLRYTATADCWVGVNHGGTNSSSSGHGNVVIEYPAHVELDEIIDGINEQIDGIDDDIADIKEDVNELGYATVQTKIKGLTYGKYYDTDGVHNSGVGYLYAYYPHLIHLWKGDVLEFRNWIIVSETYYKRVGTVYPGSTPTNGRNIMNDDAEFVRDSEVDTTFRFTATSECWFGVTHGGGNVSSSGNANIELHFPQHTTIDDLYAMILEGGGGGGSVIPDDVSDKCNEYIGLFATGVPSETFMFMSDPHLMGFNGTWSSEEQAKFWRYVNLLRQYNDLLPLRFFACGGDWLNSGDTQDNALWKLGTVDSTMRRLFRHYYPINGNHDTNYYGKLDGGSASYTGTLDKNTLMNVMFKEQGSLYYEFDGSNTHFFVFDTWTQPQSDSISSYSTEQAKWFAQALTTNTHPHIVVLTHQYYYNSDHDLHGLASAVNNIAIAFNARSTVTVSDTTYDFSAVTTGCVHIIIAGHNHGTIVIEGSASQIPVYIAPNMQHVSAQATFDCCFIDYTAGLFKTLRIGDGSNQEITLASLQ